MRKRSAVSALMAVVLMASLLVACAAEAKPVDFGLLEADGAVLLKKGDSYVVPLEWTFNVEGLSDEEQAELAAQVEVQWHSADEKVAAVHAGVVTAVGVGRTEVRAACTVDGEEKILVQAVEVYVPLRGATMPKQLELALNLDETALAGVQLSPLDASGTSVSYATSDETVAVVDETGEIRPVGVGACTLTAAVAGTGEAGEASGFELECEVRVYIKPTEIQLAEAAGQLYVGDSLALEPSVLPEEAELPDFTFAVEDEAVATVDGTGVVTALAEGSTVVTVATAGGLEAAFALQVARRPAAPAPQPPAAQQETPQPEAQPEAPAHVHTPSPYPYETYPDCVSPGTRHIICDVCQIVYTTEPVYEPRGHRFAFGACYDCGAPDPNYVPPGGGGDDGADG